VERIFARFSIEKINTTQKSLRKISQFIDGDFTYAELTFNVRCKKIRNYHAKASFLIIKIERSNHDLLLAKLPRPRDSEVTKDHLFSSSQAGPTKSIQR